MMSSTSQLTASGNDQEKVHSSTGAYWPSGSRCTYHGQSLNFYLGLANDSCTLFESTEFSLLCGKVTGLVGINGAGKSSLAKVIRGKEILGFPKDLKVEYICPYESSVLLESTRSVKEDLEGETENVSLSNLTAKAYMQYMAEQRVTVLRDKISSLENLLDSQLSSDEMQKVVNQLEEEYDILDTAESNIETEISKAVEELSFDYVEDKLVSELSVGWIYKCNLVSVLTVIPDILIIDEPSFLDTSSKDWLIQKLSCCQETIILLISHKESLLESLCDRILYINAGNQTLSSYNCGYNTFRNVHLTAISQGEQSYETYQEKVNNAEKSLQRISIQMKKGEKNLSKLSEQSYDTRFIKGKSKESKQNVGKSAASKLKKLQKEATEMEDLKRQYQTEKVKPLEINGIIADGTLIKLESINFGYSNGSITTKIFENLNVRVEPEDRIILQGPNGCGKSTLVNLILGEITPDSGLVVFRARPVVFPQTALMQMTRFHNEQTPLMYLRQEEGFEEMTRTNGQNHLAEFGLKGKVTSQLISTLSAGQKIRLWIAKQLLNGEKPSLLILDEVSENIDIETRESLINIVSNFNGAIIMISHDEDFCSGIKPPYQIWNIINHTIQIKIIDE